MDRFLVQVSRDIGYANITNNRRYQNELWMNKPRDQAHGDVQPGDELVVYCTSNVSGHRQSLAFSTMVKSVSSDRVTFTVEETRLFKSPLKRNEILDLVNRQKLPEVFRKCGQQGFNIVKLDPSEVSQIFPLLGVEENPADNIAGQDPTEESPRSPTLRSEEIQAYSIDDIISDGSFLDESRLKVILDRLRNKKNIILQGPPGTGKTWLAKKLAFALIGKRSDSQVHPLQFHPNLSYEDFVRGWRPNGSGTLDLIDGPFLKVVNDAKRDATNDYVVVIEEINRGNPAQIFGEMLTLLESDKRGSEEALALSYSRDSQERVHIPSNLYVIGTMNVADRSLALVDLALRRRFAFIDLEPIFGEQWREWVKKYHDIDDAFLDMIEGHLVSLNQTIAADIALGPQFRIGHSFVTPTSTTHSDDPNRIDDPNEWFQQVVETEIGPLLEEYWFDDTERARSERSKLLQGIG